MYSTDPHVDPDSWFTFASLASMTISSGTVTGTVFEAIRAIELSYSVSEASQLTLTVADDPDLTLLRSGFLAVGTVIGNAGAPARYWTVVRSGLAGTVSAPLISVTAQPHQIVTLRGIRGAQTWLKTSPSQFAQNAAAAYGCYIFIVEPTPVRAAITRVQDANTNESMWDLMVRLADETGCLMFIDGNTFYFGRPTWLAERMPWFTVDRAALGDWLVEAPSFSETELDSTAAATCGLTVQRSRIGSFAMGRVVSTTGWGRFDRAWMITGVNVALDDVTPPTVTLTAPVDPIVSDPALAPPPRPVVARWRLNYPTVTVDPQAGHNFVWPAAGQVRSSDITHGAAIYGVDGQSVYAPCTGRVEWVTAGTTSTVQIIAGPGYGVEVGHVDALTVGKGQRVTRGQRIGQLPPAGLSDPNVTVKVFGFGTYLDPVSSEQFPELKVGQ